MLYLYHVNKPNYYEVSGQFIIGRTTGEIIFPEDGQMSGKHVQLSLETIDGQEVLYIQDLGSKNCTYVNRSEIPANQKYRIKMYNFLEVGDQQFIVTDNTNCKIQDLEELVSKQLTKAVIRLSVGSIEMPAIETEKKETIPTDIIKVNEEKILQLQKDIFALEQSTKSELLKLEVVKEKLTTKLNLKKTETAKAITTLQLAIDKNKEEMAKFKSEIEMKKKKIINLKDIPTDSTEELPE